MNIKFKDSEEYKSLMQDLKKESLKVKNENIHLTAQMKHLAKEHEELKMIDDIVKSYLNAIGYEIDDYGDSENEEESERDDLDFDNIPSKKTPTDYIYEITKKMINVLDVGVRNVLDYIKYAYKRYSSRLILKDKHKKLKAFFIDLIKNRIRDENRKTTKKVTEVVKESNKAIKNIGMWRVSYTYLLRNLSTILAKRINSCYRFFFGSDDYTQEDDSMIGNSITLVQATKLQERFKKNLLGEIKN
jgi:hypothetical protein